VRGTADIKYGLISADSHALLDRNAYTERMSGQKWGDLIPQLVEVMDKREGHLVHRWKVYGHTPENDRGFNCPAALENSPLRNIYPKRWEDVPPRAYDPMERLEVLGIGLSPHRIHVSRVVEVGRAVPHGDPRGRPQENALPERGAPLRLT